MSYINPVLISCCIDYFCFALSILSDEYKETITTNIQIIANAIAEQESITFSQVLYPKSGYALSIRLPLFTEITHIGSNNETPHLFIQLDPRRSNRSFFKCEVKGHPLSKRQWFCVRLWLETLLSKPLYKELMLEAKVSKIDLAADFEADIEHFLFDHTRAQVGGIFFDRNGLIRTVYIGSMKSNYRVCIYCRRTKLEQIGKPSLSSPTTRIETRLKLQNTRLFEMANSAKFGQPFSKFTIYDFYQMCDSKIVSDDFLDLCRAWGFKTMMQRLSQGDCRKIRAELKRFEVLMVDEELIMEYFRRDLKKLDVLNVNFDTNCKQAKKATKQFKRLYNVN
jgi:hypothetical protein